MVDGQVSGFRKVTIADPIVVRADAAATVRMPTFSDPEGTIELVRIATGKLKGDWVDPSAPGVVFTPD